MAGNNFITNPGGSTAGKGKGQPDSYGASRPQQANDDSDINPAEVPEGGKVLAVDPPPDPGNPIGVGTGGKKPFRVK